MNYVYVGTIINTHGIKGELRLLSNFDRKDLIFTKGFALYIGESKAKELINTYRPHKHYDMITLDSLDDINKVLKYKEKKVYINRSDLNLKESEYLLQDLIGLNVISNNEYFGKISEIYETKSNILLYIEFDKPYYIPYIKEFIKKVDLNTKKIIVERAKEFYEI